MSNYLEDGYHRETAAAYAPVDERISFIRKTYLHLAVSVAGLVGILALLKLAHVDREIIGVIYGSPISLLFLMVFFIGGGWLARYMARAEAPPAVKYAGLAIYTAIEAVFLLPIITFAEMKYGMEIINQASMLTMLVFGGLTVTVFVTKKDFSFLRYGLVMLSLLMLGLILLSIVGPYFGLSVGLGMWFSGLGIALAAGYILYDTSNILHHYNTDEHVGAALELLADVVLLFYYILRLLMQNRD
ncbi:Bax inhibitor-1/YccA family protein [Zavarzinella formosa]|uniref:Bax inhibitor-1/YccA family protein n=1 Tax=Zavarzinella formosa TaxID=360055 RepID=UPI0002F8CE2C|nr:Bax inhibitor-1 family protein [Zavarzinella formosa]